MVSNHLVADAEIKLNVGLTYILLLYHMEDCVKKITQN